MKLTTNILCLLSVLTVNISVANTMDENEEKDAEIRSKAHEQNETSHAISMGTAYSDWTMPKMSKFSTDTSGTGIWWIEYLNKQLEDAGSHRTHLFRYEKSFLNDHDTNNNSGVENYLQLLGRYQFSDRGFVKYYYENFTTNIIALEDSDYSNQHGEIVNLNQGDSLEFDTKFRDLEVGYVTDTQGLEYFLFTHDYRKPYTMISNGSEVESTSDLLRNAKFLAYGFGFRGLFDNNNDGWYSQFEFYLGFGDVKLSHSESYPEGANDNIVYFNPRLKVGYAKSYFNQQLLLNASIYADWREYRMNDSGADFDLSLIHI